MRNIIIFFGFVGILVTVAACSSGNTNTQPSNADAAANTAVAASTTPAAPETPVPNAPDALVRDLYDRHDANRGPFFENQNRAVVEKYFVKTTADVILRNAAESPGNIGAISTDPLYDAQDTAIKNFTIQKPVVRSNKANVTVTFENLGIQEQLIYALATENDRWKIQDIKYKDGRTLLRNYKENSAAAGKNDVAGNAPPSTAKASFKGTYQVGDKTCTVTPTKTAFEVKCANETGTETFFYGDQSADQHVFTSEDTGKGISLFALNEQYDNGVFINADSQKYPVKKIK